MVDSHYGVDLRVAAGKIDASTDRTVPVPLARRSRIARDCPRILP